MLLGAGGEKGDKEGERVCEGRKKGGKGESER